MAVQPFKGSRQQWLDANGFRHVVRARAGRWELREFPEQTSNRWGIYVASKELGAEAHVHPSNRGGWVFDRDGDEWFRRVDRFESPVAAFEWWVGQRS